MVFQMSSTSTVLDAPNSASKPISVNHVDNAHRHSCPHCPYRTYTTKSIKEQIQSSHTIAKAFKCPHCTYSTNAGSSLPAHVKLHKNTDWQPPQNAVAPMRGSPEPAMPLLKRRPLSNIGNDSSASKGENKASVFPSLRRTNSAAASVAETTVAKHTVAPADVSSLDAAIAEAEENAKRERMRSVMERIVKKEEKEEMMEEKRGTVDVEDTVVKGNADEVG
ncbi:hypothetical protein PENTCL1PPCAC_4596 [Pristionchus entomophagus]|uniref:C2H2-type domain-containing protein n=1 Tax=Pristionchus entomophagus TaxID=358040 RepID=A0AAV5SGD1_9BILA|nr:hypothetical protein PENTCL1PPCAC_4596 [Pristionchus entomophagus]